MLDGGEEWNSFQGLGARRPARRPHPLVTGLFVVVLGALLIIAIVGAPPDFVIVDGLRTRLLALGAFCLGLAVYTRLRYTRPQKSSRHNTVVWPLPTYQTRLLQRSAGQIGASSLAITTSAQERAFLYSLVLPSKVRLRITERYSPVQNALEQRVTIEGQLPELYRKALFDENPATKSFPFPLLVVPRGTLVDNLRVVGADGSELPLLPYRHYLQLVARCLRTLLNIAFGAGIDQPPYRHVREVESIALAAILRRGDGSKQDHRGRDLIRDLKPQSQDGNACEMAAELVHKLMDRYAIVAMVPIAEDGRFLVTYERLMLLTVEAGRKGLVGWLRAHLRAFLGVSPSDVTIRPDNAPTTQSYHLVVNGSEGFYVGAQESPELVPYINAHGARLRTDQQVHFSRLDTPPPYFRFRHRAGQAYAHFYTRFFPHPQPDLEHGKDLPLLRFRFFEVPPGSVFRAFITAFAAASFILIIGLVTDEGKVPQTDAPAYLLAFPALVGGWLGFDASRHPRLLHGSLAARLSLILTVASSIGASGLFLAYQKREAIQSIDAIEALSWKNPAGMTVLGVESVWWSVLILGSILNAIAIGYVSLARAWEYNYISRGSG